MANPQLQADLAHQIAVIYSEDSDHDATFTLDNACDWLPHHGRPLISHELGRMCKDSRVPLVRVQQGRFRVVRADESLRAAKAAQPVIRRPRPSRVEAPSEPTVTHSCSIFEKVAELDGGQALLKCEEGHLYVARRLVVQ